MPGPVALGGRRELRSAQLHEVPVVEPVSRNVGRPYPGAGTPTRAVPGPVPAGHRRRPLRPQPRRGCGAQAGSDERTSTEDRCHGGRSGLKAASSRYTPGMRARQETQPAISATSRGAGRTAARCRQAAAIVLATATPPCPNASSAIRAETSSTGEPASVAKYGDTPVPARLTQSSARTANGAACWPRQGNGRSPPAARQAKASRTAAGPRCPTR